MSSQSFNQIRNAIAGRLGFAILLTLFSLTPIVRGQDAVRPSLAGEAASEARRQAVDQIPYNLSLGPVKLRFSGTAGFEYNDNINLADDAHRTPLTANVPGPQSDFIFRPQLNTDVLWPVTQLNTLRFDLGLGYAFYLNHSQYNTHGVLLTPGSQLAFDIFVGDFRINLHDRFSLQQDPVSEVDLSNTADYGRFENTAGVSLLWDLNKAVVTLGYDHYNFLSTTSQFDYLNRNAEELTGSIDFTLTSTTSAGIETSFVDTYYNQHVLNDSDSYSAGVFVETTLTNYLKLRVAGGYQGFSFDSGGVVNDQHDLNSYYANLLITHRINAAITQSLSVGRETQLGVNSNYTTLTYVRHNATWNVLYHTLLSTELFYEDADDSGGEILFPAPGIVLFDPYASEHIHRYGGALTLGYQLTKHVTLGMRYQYTQKDSDQPLRDYKQNQVSFDGTYSF